MNWTLDKSKPICPQICQQLCASISAGEYLPNQRLMSVREVALTAGVNPNTVQRAFAQLEQEGILYSERGAGWFVSENTAAARDMRRELVRRKTESFFREMDNLGVSAAEVKRIVEEWEYE